MAPTPTTGALQEKDNEVWSKFVKAQYQLLALCDLLVDSDPINPG